MASLRSKVKELYKNVSIFLFFIGKCVKTYTIIIVRTILTLKIEGICILATAQFYVIKLVVTICSHRGSYISAHVLLNLLIQLGKRDEVRGLSSILSLFRNEFKNMNYMVSWCIN